MARLLLWFGTRKSGGPNPSQVTRLKPLFIQAISSGEGYLLQLLDQRSFILVVFGMRARKAPYTSSLCPG